MFVTNDHNGMYHLLRVYITLNTSTVTAFVLAVTYRPQPTVATVCQCDGLLLFMFSVYGADIVWNLRKLGTIKISGKESLGQEEAACATIFRPM